MTQEQLARVEELYFRLRSMSAAEREAVLASEGDSVVRDEVLAMVKDVPAEFLCAPALGADVLRTLAGDLDPMVGGTIGPYRVEKLLGAGGMGAVYLGTRIDGAFDQRVAIKVVRRGMDTDDILRRFKLERRTLAQLRHANIALLQDAGSLSDGRPYLVMEYVEGTPLNQYCRENGLDLAARLRLFNQVCAAVQFAHQNLVIHRDLKPSNILVTKDGIPKLLDFGIAKVLSQGHDATPVTGMEEQRLTPEYASPEQIEGRAVTTTTDIYSLGVVLYEMLAGRTPYQFKTRAPAEIQRISKTAPPPPSAVAGEAEHDAGAQRLRRELRGDIDTIVLMAMRREPERRYTSAEQLAADIDRYLRGLPVLARRDTLLYRTSKLLKRRALASSLAALVVVAAGFGIGAVVWQAGIAKQQRDAAFIARDQQEAVAHFLHDVLASADPFGAGNRATVNQVLDAAADRINGELRDQPLVQASIRSTLGMAYLGLGDNSQADKQIRLAYEQRLKMLGPNHHDVAESKIDLAALLYSQQKLDEAEALLRDALTTFQGLRGEHNLDVARSLSDLGAVLLAKGKVAEAGEALQTAVAMREKESGSSLALAESLGNLASVRRAEKKFDEAERLMGKSIDMYRSLLHDGHPTVAISISKLAVMVQVRGDVDRAGPLYAKAIDLETKALGPDHPELATTLSSYGTYFTAKGDFEAAVPVFRNSLRIRRAHFPENDPRVLRVRMLLADSLASMKRDEDAANEFEEALKAVMNDADSAARTKVIDAAALYFEKHGNTERAQEILALRARKK